MSKESLFVTRVQLLSLVLCLVAMGAVRATAQKVEPAPMESAQFTTEAMLAVPGNMIPCSILKKVEPVLSAIPAAFQVDGDVKLSATIATDGSVQNVKVVEGLPQLTGPAMHAVSQWRYLPARVNGVATPVNTTLGVHFRFHPDAAEARALTALQGRAIPVPSMAMKTALPAPPAGVLRISERVMNERVEKKVDPTYPADAVALDARGVVILLATIDKAGTVSDVQILSGPLRFRDSASAAVKQWKYRPYMVDDNPADVQTTITLTFAPQ